MMLNLIVRLQSLVRDEEAQDLIEHCNARRPTIAVLRRGCDGTGTQSRRCSISITAALPIAS